MTALEDNLYRLALPTPFDVGPVNCYLLKGDPPTLVDPGPGMESAYEALRVGLDQADSSLDAVQRILVTHPHLDHFGLAGRIRSESGAELLVHPDARKDISDYYTRYEKDREFFGTFLQRMGMPEKTVRMVNDLPKSFVDLAEPTAIDGQLEDREVIEAGEFTLMCVDSPGHCDGSYTYLCEDHTFALTGDHVLKHISPNALLQVRDGKRRHSLLRYLRSLRTLKRSLEGRTVRGFTGHGETVPDLVDRVDELLEHHEQRQDRFYELLEDGMTAYELMTAAFPDLPAREYFLGMSEVIGHMDLLIENSRVATEFTENGHVVYNKL